MKIRALTKDDVAPVAASLAALPLMQRYRRTEAALAADLTRALDEGQGLAVAEDGGARRGFLWFLRDRTLGMGGYLKLIALFAGETGKGTGRALLRHFEAEVAKSSRHAFLLVSDFNADAQRFYEREGYARVGALPKLVLPDVDEVVYWKRLR